MKEWRESTSRDYEKQKVHRFNNNQKRSLATTAAFGSAIACLLLIPITLVSLSSSSETQNDILHLRNSLEKTQRSIDSIQPNKTSDRLNQLHEDIDSLGKTMQGLQAQLTEARETAKDLEKKIADAEPPRSLQRDINEIESSIRTLESHTEKIWNEIRNLKQQSNQRE